MDQKKMSTRDDINGLNNIIEEDLRPADNKQNLDSQTNRIIEQEIESSQVYVTKRLENEDHSSIKSTSRMKYSVTDGQQNPVSLKRKDSLTSNRLNSALRNKQDSKSQRVQPKVEEEEDDSDLCIICFGQKANCIFLDCGHGVTCMDCAIDIMKNNNNCVLCREAVTQLIEIELDECQPQMHKVICSYYISVGNQDSG